MSLMNYLQPSLCVLFTISGCFFYCGCSRMSQPEVVKTSYFHEYGPQVAEADWKAQGSSGEIVELLKDGVEVRKEYRGGVLQGTSSWTFPYSKIVERFEEYENGVRVLSGVNYENGVSQIQEEWLPDDRKLIHAWYEDGTPRLMEEYRQGRLAEAQYFTLDGEIEASIETGNGIRVERTRGGELVLREKFRYGQLVGQDLYYPNGRIRESIAYKEGKRHGETKRFAETGAPLAVEQWKEGLLDGTQLIFEHGNPVRQIGYSMGKKEGLERHFRPGTSDVVEEITWHQDIRHGTSKAYFDDQVITEWYWKGGRVSEEQYQARVDNAPEAALITSR